MTYLDLSHYNLVQYLGFSSQIQPGKVDVYVSEYFSSVFALWLTQADRKDPLCILAMRINKSEVCREGHSSLNFNWHRLQFDWHYIAFFV